MLPNTPDIGHELNIGLLANEAITFLVEALENPLRPRQCGPSIAACMMAIKADGRTTGNLLNGNYLFCSTIIAFLTAKCSLVDIEALDHHWAICRCSSSDVMGHNHAELMHDHFADMEKVIHDSRKCTGRRFGDKVNVL